MGKTFQFFRQLSSWTDKAILVLSILLLIAMLSLSLAAIFSQVIFNAPIAWGYSLTRLFLPWIALLSITVTLKAGEHIGIGFFLKMLPQRFFSLANRLNIVVIMVFGLALMWYGSGFFINSTQTFMVSDTLRVSHKWTAASVPLTGVVIVIHVLGGIPLSKRDDLVEDLDIDQGDHHG
jgi:TRAP-type C4-dicarboxylate transport system permease small subunit